MLSQYSKYNSYLRSGKVAYRVTQKVEAATPETPAVLKCTIAVIDDQNTVQTDGADDPMTSVYVTTKTLQTDGGGVVNVADHVADLVASCIVEVANCLAVHSSIAAMAIPSG
ncbi:hypothetical protein [uncultured Microbulbifer sp.]|uniref:hypothetical protein n=1 Tax=uncultured Microbulbifer sp. TaxID=348147 RepID=UPI00262B88C2|nr:hypothetical protein [uncultured Microbulbifer sp.]